MKLWKKNVLIILSVSLIAFIPLLLVKDTEFAGTDDLSGDIIEELSPGHTPWFKPLIELPGGEMETLLFSLQAAFGAGIGGFVLGRITANKPEKSNEYISDR